MLKKHHSNVRSMKNVAVLMEDGEFALIFRPHPREFAISRGEKSAKGLVKKYRGVGRSREGVGHEVLNLVPGVGRAIFSYP